MNNVDFCADKWKFYDKIYVVDYIKHKEIFVIEKDPAISVIIPLYNAEKYVIEAIQSIENQTFKNWELIIIDDCSSDNSFNVVKNYIEEKGDKIRLYRHLNNCGISFTRNEGIEMSRGKYVAFLDDDDVSVDDRLEVLYDYFQSYPSCDVVGGRTDVVDSTLNSLILTTNYIDSEEELKMRFMFHNNFCNCETMMKKDFLLKYGIKYEDKFYGLEDFRFWTKCEKFTDIKMIDKVLLKHRISNSNETLKIKQYYDIFRFQRYNMILKEYILSLGFKLTDLELSYFLGGFVENWDRKISVFLYDKLNRVYDRMCYLIKEGNVIVKNTELFYNVCHSYDYTLRNVLP